MNNQNITVMKINRNYRFVLTVLDNEKISAGEIRIDSTAVTGERMFASECHYYVEKNILECLKEADKRNDLSSYYGHTYCIYKENKSKKETTERQEGDKKIVKTREIPGEAMLLEVITVDKNGVNIR